MDGLGRRDGRGDLLDHRSRGRDRRLAERDLEGLDALVGALHENVAVRPREGLLRDELHALRHLHRVVRAREDVHPEDQVTNVLLVDRAGVACRDLGQVGRVLRSRGDRLEGRCADLLDVRAVELDLGLESVEGLHREVFADLEERDLLSGAEAVAGTDHRGDAQAVVRHELLGLGDRRRERDARLGRGLAVGTRSLREFEFLDVPHVQRSDDFFGLGERVLRGLERRGVAHDHRGGGEIDVLEGHLDRPRLAIDAAVAVLEPVELLDADRERRLQRRVELTNFSSACSSVSGIR